MTPVPSLLRGVVLLLALGPILVGCDDTGPTEADAVGETLTLSGNWQGEVVANDAPFTVTLALDHQATVVTGTGMLLSDAETAPFIVDGGLANASFSWQLTFTDRPPISLVGTVPEDLSRIDGTLAGAGFGGEQIVFTRP